MIVLQVYIVRASDSKEVESDSEDTLKRETKNMKKVSSPELQDSTKSKMKKSSEVLATRRSLRKR